MSWMCIKLLLERRVNSHGQIFPQWWMADHVNATDRLTRFILQLGIHVIKRAADIVAHPTPLTALSSWTFSHQHTKTTSAIFYPL